MGDVRRVLVVVVLYWARTVLVPIATRTYLAGLVEIPRIPVLFLVGLLSGRSHARMGVVNQRAHFNDRQRNPPGQ